jgi:hypothetical protein
MRACLATLALALLTSAAAAHDEAEWIQHGGYRNAAGELCCGERDCAALPNGDVSATAAGYLIRSIAEIIPFAEALPPPDGRYWRCEWGGRRKCFFAPPPNS